MPFFNPGQNTASAHFFYNTINRAISSRETKSLTEVGAVKNVNNGYYRKNRHSVLLRGMLFNQSQVSSSFTPIKQPILGLTQEFCWVTHASVVG